MPQVYIQTLVAWLQFPKGFRLRKRRKVLSTKKKKKENCYPQNLIRPYMVKKKSKALNLYQYFEFFCLIFTSHTDGEGNGNLLQCSCLENPRDGEAWWAAVYGVAQSQTWLKWLSSSSSHTDPLLYQQVTGSKHLCTLWTPSPSSCPLFNLHLCTWRPRIIQGLTFLARAAPTDRKVFLVFSYNLFQELS